MVIGTIAEGIARGVETVVEGVTAPFAEPAIRLGVTGLARAGKTVFITGLVANLMDRGRMPQLRAAASGAIRAAWLQPTGGRPSRRVLRGALPRPGRRVWPRRGRRGFRTVRRGGSCYRAIWRGRRC